MVALNLILRRAALMVLVLFLVSALTFGIVNVLPGDVAIAIVGDAAFPEQIERVRERMGLNEPLLNRYLSWISAMLVGDFGLSLQFDQPIGPMLFGRLKNSLILGGLTLLIAVPLAIALGIMAALRPGSWLDRIITSTAITLYSLPEYVIGLVVIMIFAIWLGLLPGSSLIAPDVSPFSRPEALILPVFVLITGKLAFLCQITRAGMIDALRSAYVRTAILKGLPMWKVVLKHAFPNIVPPTVTEIGMNFGYVLGGLVVVETLFSYAGLGQLLVHSVSFRDVPTIQAAVILIAFAYSIGNLAADVISILVNPRLRG